MIALHLQVSDKVSFWHYLSEMRFMLLDGRDIALMLVGTVIYFMVLKHECIA